MRATNRLNSSVCTGGGIWDVERTVCTGMGAIQVVDFMTTDDQVKASNARDCSQLGTTDLRQRLAGRLPHLMQPAQPSHHTRLRPAPFHPGSD